MKAIVASAMMLAAGTAGGQVIDFETTPDGSMPTDEQALPLGDQFIVDGIGFSLGEDTNGDWQADREAIFELIGQNGVDDGFRNGQTGGWDEPAKRFESQLGNWFLRVVDTVHPVLIIDYSEEVQGASGEIWDIEGRANGDFEQWRLVALDATGLKIAELLSPRGTNDFDPLDAEPWVFNLTGKGIRKIVIEFVGNVGGVGLAFNNFRATTTLPGPTLLTHQPDHPENNPAGVPQARLYWSEPVTISASDITVLADGDTNQPVPFTVEGSGTQVTTITFTGDPSGPDTGSPVPLRLGGYEILVRDTARASANNAPIDGNNDGVAGGDATLTVTHICNADIAEPSGLLDLSDISAFIEGFVNGCE